MATTLPDPALAGFTEQQDVCDFDEALRRAVREGRQEGIRSITERYTSALADERTRAVEGGQVTAAKSEKRLAAQKTNLVDSVLIVAAEAGQIGAMKLAKSWGAARLGHARRAAKANDQPAALALLEEWDPLPSD